MTETKEEKSSHMEQIPEDLQKRYGALKKKVSERREPKHVYPINFKMIETRHIK